MCMNFTVPPNSVRIERLNMHIFKYFLPFLYVMNYSSSGFLLVITIFICIPAKHRIFTKTEYCQIQKKILLRFFQQSVIRKDITLFEY